MHFLLRTFKASVAERTQPRVSCDLVLFLRVNFEGGFQARGPTAASKGPTPQCSHSLRGDAAGGSAGALGAGPVALLRSPPPALPGGPCHAVAEARELHPIARRNVARRPRKYARPCPRRALAGAVHPKPDDEHGPDRGFVRGGGGGGDALFSSGGVLRTRLCGFSRGARVRGGEKKKWGRRDEEGKRVERKGARNRPASCCPAYAVCVGSMCGMCGLVRLVFVKAVNVVSLFLPSFLSSSTSPPFLLRPPLPLPPRRPRRRLSATSGGCCKSTSSTKTSSSSAHRGLCGAAWRWPSASSWGGRWSTSR